MKKSKSKLVREITKSRKPALKTFVQETLITRRGKVLILPELAPKLLKSEEVPAPTTSYKTISVKLSMAAWKKAQKHSVQLGLDIDHILIWRFQSFDFG